MAANQPEPITGAPPKGVNEEAPQAPDPASTLVSQVIGDRYINFDQLNQYLEQTFGVGKFTIKVSQRPPSPISAVHDGNLL
jgi:hypothetical protein